MPGDRLLATLLRHLQTYTEQQDTARILGTASSLLTTLHNPLNVTLLTRQLLSAPALWEHPGGLGTCMRTIAVFHSAAQTLVKRESAVRARRPDEGFSQLPHGRTLAKDGWIEAIIRGADEHSPRWRHLLAMAGVLLGFGPVHEENLSPSVRLTIEGALVAAANLAVEETAEDDELGRGAITLVLAHAFPHLSCHERSHLHYDRLLPILMRATLHSVEGLRSAYFLATLDHDILTAGDGRLRWTQRSPSFQQIHSMAHSPLIDSFGLLSRLIAHSLEQVRQSWLVLSVLDDLDDFSNTLLTQWRQNRLSGVETTEQAAYLDEGTISVTTPVLWKLLQPILFASVIILKSALGRLFGDSVLASDMHAPKVAAQSLQILRSLYFITRRQGSATFSQYNFVYYSAMDILASYPLDVERVLHCMQPTSVGTIASHPLDRTLDLFFLNTAEHFTLTVPSSVTVSLLVPAVTPYLAAGGQGPLLSIFEAAHSLTLAIFSAPHNERATVAHLPFYVDSLFRGFPKSLSPRQFRLAFKTLLKLTSPPSPLAATQPMMPAVLLDLLRERAARADPSPIPTLPGSAEGALETPVPLSEQAVLTLTVIDGLTQVSLDLLDEWLPITADMVHDVQDHGMREHCTKHFWHILASSGELDPERSRACHAWWSTSGGKEWVLFGRDNAAMMSGGLQNGVESKL